VKLFHKIALGALLVAVVPLAAVGFSLIATQRTAVARLIAEQSEAEAQASAERIARELEEATARINATLRLVDVQALNGEERVGLLRAVYRQSPDIVSVAWVDDRGALALPLVAMRPGAPSADRIAVSAADEKTLALATSRALESPAALSAPVRFPGRRLPSLLVIAPIAGGVRVVVELSLRAPEQVLARFKPQDGRYAVLVDAHGETIAASALGLAFPPVARAKLVRVALPTGERLFGATAEVVGTHFAVIVCQTEAQAFAPLHAMQNQTLAGLGVSTLLSLAVGYALSRTLRVRLREYADGAEAFGRGALAHHIPVQSADELGLLAETLNRMAADLQKSRDEIEAWNRELQSRVEARTQELKNAQERLVLAARLTAVGHLGAGVAHEIGNPLARIIGHAQLLQLEEGIAQETKTSLSGIEAAARRASEITKALLRFSETQDAPAQDGVSLDQCADEALAFVSSQYEALGLRVEGSRAGAILTGKKSQIVQAIFQLLDNAKNASPKGGVITLQVRGTVVSVDDQGAGIPPEHLERLFDPFFTTKKVWESTGLGLSLVYRTMQEHGGRVEVASEFGRGTKVSLFFAT
jgi:signal transduction histidine kinase